MRKIGQQWASLYEQGVASFKSNQVSMQEMIVKGKAVTTEAEAYMAAKDIQYIEAKTALQTVNDINTLISDIQVNERSFMLEKDPAHFTFIETNIPQLFKWYDELDKLKPDATEQKQITDARKATQDYFAAAQKWANLQKTNVVAEGAMDKMFAGLINGHGALTDEKQKDYKASTNETERAICYQMLMLTATGGDRANAAMISSRNYMLAGKPEDWKAVNNNIEQLLKILAALNKLGDDEDRALIVAAIKATQDYLAAAKSWVESNKQMNEAAQVLDDNGTIANKCAGDYLSSKKATVDKIAESVFIAAEIADAAMDVRRASRAYMHLKDSKEQTNLYDGLGKLNKLYASLRKVSLTTEDQQRIDRAEKTTGEYQIAANSWFLNDNTLRQTILPEMQRIGESVLGTCQSAENNAWKASNESGTNVNAIVTSSKRIIVFALAAGLVIGLLASIFITRSITRPIKAIADNLFSGAQQTASAAGQVSSASQSLAEGASEQAASLEETSSSLEEMSSMTQRNTESAQKVNELGKEARTAAEKGAADMQSMSNAMDAIKVSSDDIAKIIKTIDEIAFQTNILALNAAVEAARAGEAGMGFAVVAEEVRNLAQRSAQAAKETAEKIEGAIAKTAQGVEISGKVAQGLNEIVIKARQVDELAAEVAAASREQSQGISQVNTAVTQMDKVTQGNAASAEESASAAEELNSQADSLKEAVQQLKRLVDGGSAGQAAVQNRPVHISKTPVAAVEVAKKSFVCGFNSILGLP